MFFKGRNRVYLFMFKEKICLIFGVLLNPLIYLVHFILQLIPCPIISIHNSLLQESHSCMIERSSYTTEWREDTGTPPPKA